VPTPAIVAVCPALYTVAFRRRVKVVRLDPSTLFVPPTISPTRACAFGTLTFSLASVKAHGRCDRTEREVGAVAQAIADGICCCTGRCSPLRVKT
jgi:hypothetical protein